MADSEPPEADRVHRTPAGGRHHVPAQTGRQVRPKVPPRHGTGLQPHHQGIKCSRQAQCCWLVRLLLNICPLA